jgi:methylenetetrahydrofolate dehydrogenase (NAD+)
LLKGLNVHLQIFDPAEDQYLQQVVSPAKDVEGLHFFFRFNLYHNIRYIEPASLSSGKTPPLEAAENQEPSPEPQRPGLVKAVLPCTSLAIVKVLEASGVYNQVLPYGRKAFGKTITVINRQVHLTKSPFPAHFQTEAKS